MDQLQSLQKEIKDLKLTGALYLKICRERRDIAIDMAAHVAEDYQHLSPAALKLKILNLMNIDQAQHDALVVKYRMKERHG